MDKYEEDAGGYQSSECKIHLGFSNYYRILQLALLERINTLLASDDSIEHIIFTGHSLGGAVATIAAVDVSKWLEENGNTHIETSLITFGSPRVGNYQFAHYVDVEAGFKENFRVTYNKDPVTCVPDQEVPSYNPFFAFNNLNEHALHVGIDVHFEDSKNYDFYVNDESNWKCDYSSVTDHMEYKNINKKKFREAMENARVKMETLKTTYEEHSKDHANKYKSKLANRRKMRMKKKLRKLHKLHKLYKRQK